jgi:hypothetical protein
MVMGADLGTQITDSRDVSGRSCGQSLIDVAGNNARVRESYERRGMKVEAISPSMILVPITRAYRMVKPL